VEWAYVTALEKVCTTITSGWFRRYAIENYQPAIENRPDFVASFFDGLKRGDISCLKPTLLCEGKFHH